MRLSRDNDKSGRDMEKVRDELWKTARETLVDRYTAFHPSVLTPCFSLILMLKIISVARKMQTNE